MKKYILLPLVSVFFVGCTSSTKTTQLVTTPQVKSALAKYNKAKNDILIKEYAAQEIYKATKISSKVRVQTDKELANHYAYLLNNQVKIASLTAERLDMQEKLNDVITQRNEAIDAINIQRAEEENIGVDGLQIDNSAVQSNFSYQALGASEVYTVGGKYFDNEMVRFNSELNLLIDHIVTQLKTKSNKKAVLKSYTDDAGSRSYNIDMSVRRANMIKEKIVEKGIDGSRVIVKGEGGVNFISSNDTSDGRSQNNRVEVNLIDASN